MPESFFYARELAPALDAVKQHPSYGERISNVRDPLGMMVGIVERELRQKDTEGNTWASPEARSAMLRIHELIGTDKSGPAAVKTAQPLRERLRAMFGMTETARVS